MPRQRFRWVQLGVSLTLLAALCGTAVAIDLLARWDAQRLHALRLERWRVSNSVYDYRLGFADFVDRLLLEEIPGKDHSRGGVYFFGASPVQTSIMTWELTPEERELTGNYAINTANHGQQFQFLKYLAEYEGLLGARPEDTLIVLGLWPAAAASPEQRPGRSTYGQFFPMVFERHGLYTYGSEEGIHPVPMTAFERFLRIEKVRCGVFVQGFAPLRLNPNPPRLNISRFEGHKPDAYRRFWHELFGPDWRENMDEQLDELGGMIEYVRGRGGHVAAVFMPVGSWFDGFRPAETYHREASGLCGRLGVRVIDLSDLLSGEEFMDSSHPNYQGQRKVHEQLVGLTRRFLSEASLLREPSTS